MSAAKESFDQGQCLRDVTGSSGLMGWRENTQRGVRARELRLDTVGACPPWFSLGCQVQNLVVDVGDVANEGDRVAAVGEPASSEIVDEGATKVPDVRRGLHGRPAHIDGDSSWGQRDEAT